VRGLVLSSSGLTYSYPINDLTYALLLSTYTASAQAHGKLPPDLQGDLENALKESEHFALHEFLPALARGNRLTDDERKAVIAQLARFSGLEPEVIDRNNLRVKATMFSRELLRREGFEVNAYDTRIKVPAVAGSTTGASDATKWPSGSAVTSMRERLILAQELGVNSDLLYMGPFGGEWPPPPHGTG
jgi:carboxypeptidase C (cathepsin A)